jgi:hypothetical protein
MGARCCSKHHTLSGAHAATSSVPFPASHRRDAWLGWRTLGEDSFPRAEEDTSPRSRINRASLTSSVMRGTTLAADPTFYTQPIYPLRTAERSAGRTGTAGVSLADNLNASTGMLALVLQLRFEPAPAGIQHGLCHPRLHELQTAHVAYDDVLILINNHSRELMQGIGFAARRLAAYSVQIRWTVSANALEELGRASREITKIKPGKEFGIRRRLRSAASMLVAFAQLKT